MFVRVLSLVVLAWALHLNGSITVRYFQICMPVNQRKKCGHCRYFIFNRVVYIYRCGAQDMKVSMGFQIVSMPSLFLFTSVMDVHYVLLFSKFLKKKKMIIAVQKKLQIMISSISRCPISYITTAMFHITVMRVQHFLFVYHNLV